MTLDHAEAVAALGARDEALRLLAAVEKTLDEWRGFEHEISDRYVVLRNKLKPFGALDTTYGGADRFEKTEAALDSVLRELAMEAAKMHHHEIYRGTHRQPEELVDGHSRDFEDCPHVDCVLMREVPAAAVPVSPSCAAHGPFDPRCETCPHCLQEQSLKRLSAVPVSRLEKSDERKEATRADRQIGCDRSGNARERDGGQVDPHGTHARTEEVAVPVSQKEEQALDLDRIEGQNAAWTAGPKQTHDDIDTLVAEVRRLRAAAVPPPPREEPIALFLQNMAQCHPKCGDETVVSIGFWTPWVAGAGALFNSQLRYTLKQLKAAAALPETPKGRPMLDLTPFKEAISERSGAIQMKDGAAESLIIEIERLRAALLVERGRDAELKAVPIPDPKVYWRCFHCGYIAVTAEQAADHFGATRGSQATCQRETPKERHLMDVYDSLGVKWGDDVFTAITALRSPSADQKTDYGPDPDCRDCKGSGECSNAQFRCPCRWKAHTVSEHSRGRAPMEALAQTTRRSTTERKKPHVGGEPSADPPGKDTQ